MKYIIENSLRLESHAVIKCRILCSRLTAMPGLFVINLKNVHYLVMVKHNMDVIDAAWTSPSIDNQTLFVIAKVQWTWPEMYEDNFVMKVHGIHIEMFCREF